MAEKALSSKQDNFDLTKPTDIIDFANKLKAIIVEKNLYVNIKGKNYPLVEGWQIAGAFTGTTPIVEKVENLSEGGNYKYRAEVSLVNKDGEKVGYGVAICTNKEAGKQNFDEYAVASMAQTRAVGKAYRMKIGWLLKIAGYETTPAEEMDVVANTDTKKVFSEQEIAVAKLKLGCVKDIDELKTAWQGLGDIKECPEIVRYKDDMKQKLTNK